MRRRNAKLRALATHEQNNFAAAEQKLQLLQTELARLHRSADGGGESEQDALASQEEKEKRVQELSARAGRRMAHVAVLRGWSAWQEAFYEAQRVERMLASVAGRLCKPRLYAAFRSWFGEWVQAENTSIEQVPRPVALNASPTSYPPNATTHGAHCHG